MKDKINPIIVAALVIFAFVAGSMWTRVRTMEKEKKAEPQAQEQQAQQQGQAPEKTEVLGVEDQAEIIKGAAGVKGPEDAKVTIVEFSEFQCPFCKRYVDQTYSQIMDNYEDKIRYVFRDYPLPFHQHAQTTAEASRCAGDQDQYWSFHDKLFEEQSRWVELSDAKEMMTTFAQELNLSASDFQACLDEGKYTQAVKDDFALGQKVGVTGTPTFFINGRKLVGAQPYSAFETIIKEELEK